MPQGHLPSFSFEAAISARAARQDKIEMTVQLGRVVGHDFAETAGEIENFLHYLGSPPRAQPGDEAFGRIFRRRERGVPPFRSQLIRERVTRNQPLPPPLFSGSLEIRNPRNGEPPVWSFELFLSLNLTRFLRHQQLPRPASRLRLERPRFRYDLYQSNPPERYEDEFSLIEMDNWIPDDRLWLMYASSRFLSRHLRSYVSSVVAEIRADIDRAAEYAGIRLTPPPANAFSLLYVEHYWEFFTEYPLGTVTALQPLLETFSAVRVDPRDYEISTPHLDTEANSRRLLLQTRRGEYLRIYAKTNRRIRLEISHRMGGRSSFGLDGGHTASTIEGILSIINSLGEIAARRVNEVLNHFRLQRAIPEEQRPVLAFICDFQAAFEDPDKAHQLLQILTSNLSLTVGQGDEFRRVFENELRQLSRRGILRYSKDCYTVTPQYRQALESMHQSGIDFLLGVRIRRRRRS